MEAALLLVISFCSCLDVAVSTPSWLSELALTGPQSGDETKYVPANFNDQLVISHS